MALQQEDGIGSLENARERLYKPNNSGHARSIFKNSIERVLPHAWKENSTDGIQHRGKRNVRFAGIFFVAAFVFFIISLGVAVYFFYFEGNSVSVDKIIVDIHGPTTIAGGDTVPLSLTITNKNPVSIKNATIEIDFPNDTRSAVDVLSSYPRYIENLGTLASGATITRSIKAVVFGGAGQSLSLPVSFSYGTSGSSAVFVKKSAYTLAVSSTPLSVSIAAPSETVSGKPLTFEINVRSNATVPISNVILSGSFPFGFVATDSSLPLSGSNIYIGAMQPGASKTITLTGTLTGQNSEQRVFHFTVGTSKTAKDRTLAVSYMTQDATVTISAPFITATLALNGDSSEGAVVTPGSHQSVAVSYSNTLSTSVTNATIAITLSGSAIDYDSIRTTSGFYRSIDRTILFSKDTDPSLARLSPNDSGIGSFTFSTLPQDEISQSQTITFTISVSGTRVGQTNVIDEVNASVSKTVKVATVIALSASSLHSSGPFGNSGPVPPRANQSTTYAIVWNVRNGGNTIANASVFATLPSYVSYTGVTAGSGSFSYNKESRVVSWNIGDIAYSANIQGAFQISLTPSTSQNGSAPQLTGTASFSGHDRFAGVQINAHADPSTTETKGDIGYTSTDAIVQ